MNLSGADLKRTWRSWFWNSMLVLGLSIMAGLCLAVAASESDKDHALVAGGFGLASLILAIGIVRSARIGVTARESGIVVRGLTKSTFIPWSEVAEIKPPDEPVPLTVTAPTIVRRRPGKSDETIMLSEIGGYGVFRRKDRKADQAYSGLVEAWGTWRGANHK